MSFTASVWHVLPVLLNAHLSLQNELYVLQEASPGVSCLKGEVIPLIHYSDL